MSNHYTYTSTIRIEAFRTRLDKSKVLKRRRCQAASYFPATSSENQKPLECSLLEQEIQAYRYKMSATEDDEDTKYLYEKYAHLFGLSKAKSWSK